VKVVVPGYVLKAVGVPETFDAPACQLVIKNLDMISENGFELETRPVETFSAQRSKFLNSHKMWVILFAVASLVMLAVVAYMVTRHPVAVKFRS
jgi:hypothetical protein